MGLLERIKDLTRATMNEGRSLRGKPLSELSDTELEEELIRRRRARAG